MSSADIENNNNNKSSINFRECENKIKISKDLNINKSLLILRVDINEIGKLMPIIEYGIYNIETKEKFNLSLFKNDKIDISILVNIDENNLYKYNISDEYYNDIRSINDNDVYVSM